MDWGWRTRLIIWMIEMLITLVRIKDWYINPLFLFLLEDFWSIILRINYRWIQIPKIITFYNFFHNPYLIFHLLCSLRKTSNPNFLYIFQFTILMNHLFISILIFSFRLAHMLFVLTDFILHLSVKCLLPFDPLKILKHLRRKKVNSFCHLKDLSYLTAWYAWVECEAWVVSFTCLFYID